ncbi:peptidoglycan DD-metalloendopeptidase family protein [Turicibacter sanguinis]|uniref:peptidoglycan DD-metalloendopeptidase family protein n=1 Tax=Turicibacter sanguinis TaxID=154288 RepID=UPI001EE8B8B7|nr:M23 family metallopeptidase [Turicibacter sanguinis]MCU7211191.1 peptidoglycan DD-metalloendopeptidase family protein [Turicibacter sanguinis]MDB8575958.1 peptidoglycan DD-metalloendopeptidase family protein [Turicibacter sanguinis]MDB8578600.1 peptidoglycan DD-metalloendopeptidase family protein [Turicibacter sanguinis]MDB8584535.1 peptidoglycan DD-metalloendopeptidase family protein [Turicibacter sanguinis]MDB8587508.1 peptidoglycan DD-metalloendopeptidase family protein [Turicibacter san
MKKKLVGAVIATMMFANSQQQVTHAQTVTPNNQHVVYRIYINDEVVGLINNKEEYDTFIENHMKELLQQYPDQVIYAPTNVRVEEEVTLLPVDSIDNQAVLSQVAEKADFKTSTNVVTIGEQKFAVKDTAVVESTLMDLMKYYTGTENLAKIMDTENPIQALSETGSQYIGAKVVEPVKVESSYAAPDEVLTTDQMRRMMLYGQKEPQQTVTFGEDSSLWYIARDYGLTEEELILLNPQVEGLKWGELLGMELDVTPLNPIIHVQTEQEKVNVAPIFYETEYIDDETMLKGQTKVTQTGQNGEFLTRTKVEYVNGEQTNSTVVEETQLSEPVKEVIIRGTKVVSGVGTGNWVWPTTSRNVTCGYLCYSGHYAIDISASTGQSVYAADNGVVVSASYNAAYGNVILINHKNGYYTRYAHLNSMNVKAGDIVEAGQLIGGAGNTGNSTGTHLHFEIRTNTGSQPSYAPNPLDFY